MVLFHIGWAKPVPINARNFKNPKRDFAITAAAGPASNLILGFVSALIYLLFYACVKDMTFETRNFQFYLITNVRNFIYIFHSINIGLGLFNLLPIPPFDGSRLLNVFLPEKTYFKIMEYERYIYYGVLGWLLFGSYVTRILRSIPIIATNPVLYLISGIFSLSGVLNTVIGWVSNLMFSFWELFPFL
jgi:Zn-dependent protease